MSTPAEHASPDGAATAPRRLTLLPAVDVAGGQAVRLVQGAAGTETGYGDPLEAALAWQRSGAEWIHLVDLDAAFGRGSNAALLGDLTGRLDINVELSGGIRDDAAGEPGLGAFGHRPARRQDRGRAGRARHPAGRPWLDLRRR